MVRQIVIEAETPGDSRTMFRLRIDATRVAGDLTAVQAHILVGEILERIAVPKRAEADVATPSPSRLRAAIGALFGWVGDAARCAPDA